jgi:hypothetical protein
MRSIPGPWSNESISEDRAKRIENWAESIPSISEVWVFSPRLPDGSGSSRGFESNIDLGVRLGDQPSEQELGQRIGAWSTILSAALKLQVHIRIVREPTASDDVLKARLLQRTVFRRPLQGRAAGSPSSV